MGENKKPLQAAFYFPPAFSNGIIPNMKKLRVELSFDNILLFFLILVLAFNYFKFLQFKYSDYVLIAIAIIGTVPVVSSAYESIVARKINIDLLAGIALVFALVNGEWVSAVFINLMLTSARIFLSYNQNRARKNIEHLLKLKPKKIKIKEANGTIIEVNPKSVKVGDIVVVDLGERVPIDGIVVSGEAAIDESPLTGESIPVNKKAHDKAYSSTLVLSGNVLIKAEKVGAETTLEKIIKLVEEAQIDKPEVHTSAEKFATWYIIAIFAGSLAAYLLTYDLNFVLAIMLVVCADDVAVAVPLAFLTAISFAAKNGVIIKGASFIEALKDTKVIFVDKTGTLTKGKLKVEKFVSDFSDINNILEYVGSMVELSDHPISNTIAEYIQKDRALKPDITPEQFKEVKGNGISAKIKGDEISLGKLSYVEALIPVSQNIKNEILKAEEDGFNVTIISLNKSLAGYFILADEIKLDIKDDIVELKKLGVERIIMLTGDNDRVAKRISETLGLTEFHANLLPEEKLAFIKKTLSKKYKTIMVGDGINDAAALSLADIGIAMGGIGLDITIESADIVLMKDDFSKIPNLIRLSKYIMKISNQDFMIWGATNFIGLGAVLTRILMPNGAAAYNFLTDFIPLINSTRVFSLYFKGRR